MSSLSMLSDPQQPSLATPTSVWGSVRALFAFVVLAMVVYVPFALGASYLNFDDNFFFGPDNPVFARALAAAAAHGWFAGLAIVLDPGSIIAYVWLPVAHGSLFLDASVSGHA